MDIYHVCDTRATRLDAPIAALPPNGFLWLDATHDDIDRDAEGWRDEIARLIGVQIVDPHLIDAANLGHPSFFDSTQDYEMVVFRKLAVGDTVDLSGAPLSVPLRHAERASLMSKIATKPVTFFLCERALVTVSSRDSRTIDQVRRRLLDYRQRTAGAAGSPDMADSAGPYSVRLPARPEDLMLRLLNAMVDRYLELRQPLTDQLDRWQRELLDPRRSFQNWSALLDARIELRKLENLCEEQHDAMQEFRDSLVDSVDSLESAHGSAQSRRQDIVLVRISDVMEHITRVLHHARRLQDSIESAVQLHFSATAHRTNQIVRVLTVITAIFAPLTLLSGIFGMNFEIIPGAQDPLGFWITVAAMLLIAVLLLVYFQLKNYFDTRPRRNR